MSSFPLSRGLFNLLPLYFEIVTKWKGETMSQKHPRRAQKTKKTNPLIIAIICAAAIIIAAIIGTIGTIIAGNIQTGGKEPAPTPTSVITPTPTPIPPAFVQGSFNASFDSTNRVSLSVTPGDLLIVAVTQYERTLVDSNPVTDDKGDQYQELGNVIANPNQQQDYAELYFAQGAKGGLTTVIVSFTPPSDTDGGDTSLGLYEYRGLGSRDTALATPSKDASGKILTVSSKLNTTAAAEICFALGVDSGPQKGVKDDTTVMKGDGYTLRYPTGNQTIDSKNGERIYTEDAFVAPGGCNPNFTIAYPSFWGIIGAAFKP
jgi:hypothetical protein